MRELLESVGLALPTAKARPVAREIAADWRSLADTLVTRRRPALLESSRPDMRMGRYSYASAEPFLTVRAWGRRIELTGPRGKVTTEADPFFLLQEVLRCYPAARTEGLPPFQGGAMGFFGYDLARVIEKLPSQARDDGFQPDMDVGLYDWVLAADHEQEKTWLIATGWPEGSTDRAFERISGILGERAPKPREQFDPPVFRTETKRHDYLHAIEEAKESIAAGDIYEVNLSHRLLADWVGPVWPLYAALREGSPVPYAAYLDFDDVQVLSASPERFISLEDGAIETRPIKGTRPRIGDPVADQRSAEALQASIKDRAENLMIVDLLRNDLGKVSEIGSVKVPGLFELEPHPGVWHLVSTIQSELAEGLDALDLLRAAFPGGSVTGCPKISSMAIIDRLEVARRGVYCGAIGYVSFTGDMDTSIVIRTVVHAGGKLALQVGGAITSDSDVVDEYDETLHKARAALRSLGAELHVEP